MKKSVRFTPSTGRSSFGAPTGSGRYSGTSVGSYDPYSGGQGIESADQFDLFSPGQGAVGGYDPDDPFEPNQPVFDPNIGEYVWPQPEQGSQGSPYRPPQIPDPEPDRKYRQYLTMKNIKQRLSGSRPMSAYDDHLPSEPGEGREFGIRETGPDGTSSRIYPEPGLGELGQTDPRYGDRHLSERDLPTIYQTGDRAAYGEYRGQPVHGPAGYEKYYGNWPQIGVQYKRTPLPGKALPLDEEMYLKDKGFEFMKILGVGGYGQVWTVMSSKLFKNRNGQYHQVPIACKILNLSYFEDTSDTVEAGVKSLLHETDIHQGLKHDNVIESYDVFFIHDPDTGFPYCRSLQFMELCDGSLESLLLSRRSGHIDEKMAFEMFEQLCDGLSYLHSLNVCHLDLKIFNVMYVKTKRNIIYKLGDFGLGLKFAPRELGQLEGLWGTELYQAPESMTGRPYETKPVDIFQLGLLLAESLSGIQEFKPMMNELKVWTPAMGKKWGVSETCAKLMWQMVAKDPDDRPTIEEVRHHAWFEVKGGGRRVGKSVFYPYI